MTDEQIIKALERCFTRGFDESTCYECPFYTATAKCTEDLRDSALDLISRQKAEIEELYSDKIIAETHEKAAKDLFVDCVKQREEAKAEIERLKRGVTFTFTIEDFNSIKETVISRLDNEIKAEAIKEFAERLKSKLDNLEFRTKTHRKTVPTKFCDDNVNWVLHECVPSDIDNLVKEMTEVQE